jgi:hypothetical protein
MAATRKPGTSSGASRKKSKPAAAPARNGAPEARAVSFEAVQRRAYELFLARGGWHGADLADWLAAERELKGLTPAPD